MLICIKWISQETYSEFGTGLELREVKVDGIGDNIRDRKL